MKISLGKNKTCFREIRSSNNRKHSEGSGSMMFRFMRYKFVTVAMYTILMKHHYITYIIEEGLFSEVSQVSQRHAPAYLVSLDSSLSCNLPI